jgi:hypothetical protein
MTYTRAHENVSTARVESDRSYTLRSRALRWTPCVATRSQPLNACDMPKPAIFAKTFRARARRLSQIATALHSWNTPGLVHIV